MLRFNQKIHYLLRSNITALYIVNSMRSFALSLISIFIPVYLLQRNFTLVDVLIFLATAVTLQIFMSYFSLKHAFKKGIKQSFYISMPAVILFFILLYNITFLSRNLGNVGTVLLLGLVVSVSNSFYWTGYHVEFAKFSKKKNSAKQLSTMNILSTAASVIAPLIGALLISLFSYDVTFIAIIIIFLISLIPLIISKDDHEPFDFKITNTMKKKYKDYVLPFFSEGLYSPATAYYWPVMLYLVFTNLPKMGGIYFVSNALYAIAVYTTGQILTNKNLYKLLRFGTIMHAITLFVRGFVKDFTALIFIQGIGGISGPFFAIPYRKAFYDKSKDQGIAEIIYMRETYLNLGRLCSYLLLIALLFYIDTQIALIIMLIFSGIAIQGMNLMKA